MRFAPPKQLRIADRASGLNQVQVRTYNERLLLALLLQSGGMTRLEIGRRTGLSAQTVSVIVRSLEQEGLVTKGEAQRGRAGPPTVPISLDPRGAFSVGLSIGYRRAEVVLIDFVGRHRFRTAFAYRSPDDLGVRERCRSAIGEALAVLDAQARERVAGIGVAIPTGDTGVFTPLDGIQEDIEREHELPCFIQDDVTAAAGGESLFGEARSLSDYLYCFIGYRLEHRLILGHRVFQGRRSDTGGLGEEGLAALERALDAEGVSATTLWEHHNAWPEFGDPFVEWRNRCVERLHLSIDTLMNFVDIGSVLVSSSAPRAVCETLSAELDQRIANVTIAPCGVMTAPKATGAASLPYASRFTAL